MNDMRRFAICEGTACVEMEGVLPLLPASFAEPYRSPVPA